MFEIIPGILEKDFLEIEKKIELVKGFSKTIHVDIIDGKFADNLTILNPDPFKKYANDLFLEVHLMVEEPINYLDSFANAGFKRFLGHIEKMSSVTDFVAKAENLGEVGLALDLSTQPEIIEANLEDLDSILVMSVKAGFSGQGFSQNALDKIRKIREKSQVAIEVDGGVNDSTIAQAAKFGANRFITTSFLFEDSPVKQYEKLRLIINAQQA